MSRNDQKEVLRLEFEKLGVGLTPREQARILDSVLSARGSLDERACNRACVRADLKEACRFNFNEASHPPHEMARFSESLPVGRGLQFIIYDALITAYSCGRKRAEAEGADNAG